MHVFTIFLICTKNVHLKLEVKMTKKSGKFWLKTNKERWVSGLNHRFAKPYYFTDFSQ